MGRVPMLIMMVAAAGVTYGWQPGSNGDDDSSIQYIIQVSPQQPSDGLERHDRVRSLKPDPQAGGLSLPPSLKQFGNSAREATAKQFDKAGRELKNHARDQFNNALGGVAGNGQARPTDRNLIAPPSTRLRPGGSSNNAFSPSRPTTFSTPSFPSGNANSNLTSNQRNAQGRFRSESNEWSLHRSCSTNKELERICKKHGRSSRNCIRFEYERPLEWRTHHVRSEPTFVDWLER